MKNNQLNVLTILTLVILLPKQTITKTPMENTSDNKLKVTNNVPSLLSWHTSVTVNSVCVNKKKHEKSGKNTTRFFLQTYFYAAVLYISREGYGLRPTTLFK